MNVITRIVEDKTTPLIIIYHGGCADGTCSAWMLERFLFSDRKRIETYGNRSRSISLDPDFPFVDDKNVVMVDIAFPREEIEFLAETAKNILIIDHHKTYEEDLRDLSIRNVKTIIDIERCAAEIVWNTIVDSGGGGGASRIPWFLTHISDRDLWRWTHKDSRAFCAAMCKELQPVCIGSFDILHGMSSTEQKRFILKGKRALAEMDAEVEKLVRESPKIDMWFHGHKILYVNRMDPVNEFAEKALEHYPDIDLVVITFFKRQRNSWKVCMRSRSGSDVDVSRIAECYGGGGHTNAAQFISYKDPANMFSTVID